MNVWIKAIVCGLFLMGCILDTYSQNNSWLLGEWKGIGVIPGSAYSIFFVRTLKINMEYNNRFAGVLIQEIMNNNSIRIEKEISGTIMHDQLKIKAGRTLYKKQPKQGFWVDCSACQVSTTRITVSSDSLMLTSEIRGCGNFCDGYTTYYKSLSGFDTATQRQLVSVFGSSLLVKIFSPVTPAAIQVNSNTQTAVSVPLADSASIQNQLNRSNKIIATYQVSATEIKLELFDNGEIDGDTVTVYHNKQKVIDHQVLGLQPIVFTVKADNANRVHEFTLVANNLGRVPPNTALLRITAGKKTYELFASTNLSQNASLIIVYSGE